MLSILNVARSFDATNYKPGHRILFPMATGKKVEEQILIYKGKEEFEAFCCCYNISNIQLPDSLEELADETFYKTADTPDTLYLSKNLKKLHTRAFNLSKPKVIYIDSAIEEIDNRYYTYNYCCPVK